MLDTHFLVLKYTVTFFFKGSLNFSESDVKMHFCSMYGARENFYEFTV